MTTLSKIVDNVLERLGMLVFGTVIALYGLTAPKTCLRRLKLACRTIKN
jgi:hypothetical protein